MATKKRAEILWGIVEGYGHAKLLGDKHLQGYYLGQWGMVANILNISLTSPWAILLVEMVTDGKINTKNVSEVIAYEKKVYGLI